MRSPSDTARPRGGIRGPSTTGYLGGVRAIWAGCGLFGRNGARTCFSSGESAFASAALRLSSRNCTAPRMRTRTCQAFTRPPGATHKHSAPTGRGCGVPGPTTHLLLLLNGSRLDATLEAGHIDRTRRRRLTVGQLELRELGVGLLTTRIAIGWFHRVEGAGVGEGGGGEGGRAGPSTHWGALAPIGPSQLTLRKAFSSSLKSRAPDLSASHESKRAS